MSTDPPPRQIRAVYDDRTIRVYQAFSPAIAGPAVRAQRFVPPFKRGRLTWIKPSFTWMMYRSGWASKPDQERVLAIDITRGGFEWALAHACVTPFSAKLHGSHDAWRRLMDESPVRVQWDPEKDIRLEELPWRSIQIGLGGEAAERYVDEWIVRLEDVTALAKQVESAVRRGDLDGAQGMRPVERAYSLPAEIARRIGCVRID